MLTMRKRLGFLAAVLTAGAGPAEPAQAEPKPAGDAAVAALMQRDLDAARRDDPVGASTRGDRRFDALLPDVSAGSQEIRLSAWRTLLAEAEGIDPAGLSASGRTDRDLLIDALRTRIDGTAFREWEMAVTQINGPQYELAQIPQSVTVKGAKQVKDYVSRLEAVGAYVDATIENLRAGMARGFTPPRGVLGNVAAQALAHGSASINGDATRHAMYAPLAGLEGADAERGRKAILEIVAPAFDRLGEFLRDEYVPGCRASAAARDLPNGAAYYAYRVRVESTLKIKPEEIHETGLSEVARIRAEMMGVIRRSGFKGPDGAEDAALFAAFVAHLRTDPRFRPASAEALLTAYREAGKRIDAELPRLFEDLPKLTWGVREMPRFIAPSSPTAYYYPGSLQNGQAGFFVANTYRLDQRPLYDVLPLTLHEAVPGHHFQVALAQELTNVHEWRTGRGYTGFVEGWALYAERLGQEMGEDARSATNPTGRGLFTDPFDDFGRLNYEMWRALRLVVDTGIHMRGWSRDRAVAFMHDNSALTSENIDREVDRYISWPGQAVAYKLGELHIRALRERAEKELGDRFDVRGFHRALLGRGAVPLEVLTRQVEAWIASVKGAGG